MESLYLVLHVSRWETEALLFEFSANGSLLVARSRKQNIFLPAIEQMVLGVGECLMEMQEQTGLSLWDAERAAIASSAAVGKNLVGMASLSPFFSVKVGLIGSGKEGTSADCEAMIQRQGLAAVFRWGTADGRSSEERLKWLAKEKPHLLFICGEPRSEKSFRELINELSVALRILAWEHQPTWIFCSEDSIMEELGLQCVPHANVHYVRPNPNQHKKDAEMDEIARTFSAAIRELHLQRIPVIHRLNRQVKGRLNLFTEDSQTGLRLLSVHEGWKHVLGIRIGTGEASGIYLIDGKVAASSFVSWDSGCLPPPEKDVREIAERMMVECSLDEVRSMACNKAIMPWIMPTSGKELALEHAMTSFLLDKMRTAMRRSFSSENGRGNLETLSALGWSTEALAWLPFETVVIQPNEVIKQLSLAHRLLLWLEGLQPVGFCLLYEDEHAVLPAAGALAGADPYAAAELLKNQSLNRLGAVISLLSKAQVNTPVLRVKIVVDDGREIKAEINQGEIFHFPLDEKAQSELYLKPLQGTDIGFGKNKGAKLSQFRGGKLGIIIDGRGRPLPKCANFIEYRNQYQHWISLLKGKEGQ